MSELPPTGTPDRTIDLRAEICPMTFVRTRLALDAMAPGQLLLVLLDGAEPQARVPQTLRDQGHTIVATSFQTAAPATMEVWVRKSAPAAD